MSLEDLEARTKVLEDIEAIKKLKARYCYLADAGLDDPSKWDELMTHFSESAKIDFGPFGVHEGKEAVKRFFTRNIARSLSFSWHMAHNPIIEVEGRKAKGTWYFEVPLTDRRANRAVWAAGTYDEEYIKEDGEWKFSFMKAHFSYYTPFDEGWVKTRMMG